MINTLDFENDKIDETLTNNMNLPDVQLKASNVYNRVIGYVKKNNLVS